jgi:hypothetical protein
VPLTPNDVSVPREVMFGCAFVYTVPATNALLACPVTFAPAILNIPAPLPEKLVADNVSVDLSNPNFDKAVELIPENKDLLESVVYTSKRFVLNYLHNVTSRMEVRDLEGKLLYDVKLNP